MTSRNRNAPDFPDDALRNIRRNGPGPDGMGRDRMEGDRLGLERDRMGGDRSGPDHAGMGRNEELAFHEEIKALHDEEMRLRNGNDHEASRKIRDQIREKV